ncbi:MAG: hypothetical protein LUF32_04480 [Clostridiales bacterium]|nr:hypothetical protein [Clostridiales bacterium]
MNDYTKILPTGKNNAIPSKRLAYMMGFRTVRQLQEDIARCRADGQVICSSAQGGYYLPKNKDEIREFIAVTEARAANTFAALKSARRALQEYDGQGRLDDLM